MKNVLGGLELKKGCTMDCESPGHSYGDYLGTACTQDSDCTSTKVCEEGYTRSFHCS